MTTALSHSWHHYVAQPHIDPPYTPQNRLHESDGRWEDIVKTESRALSGDVEAAYRLGTRFDFGEGTPRNSAAALQWYAKASEAGHGSLSLFLNAFNIGCRI
jgi:TPR repeat protein